MNKLLKPLVFGLALVASAAGASTLTYTQDWAGTTVSMNYPDKVIYQTAFDWSFTVDSSTMTSYDAIGFLADVGISNTVDLSHATWTYQSTTGGSPWLNASGFLGDSFTTLSSTATGHQVAFTDPFVDPVRSFTGPYSMLWKDYQDTITWTLGNIIIQGDTAFSLRLDDGGILEGGSTHNIVVIDPPAPGATIAVAPAAVPLPPTYALMLAGLGALAVLKRRRSSAPALAG